MTGRRRPLAVLIAVAVVAVVLGILASGGDGGDESSEGVTTPTQSSTPRPPPSRNPNGQAVGAGCDVPSPPVRERIGGKASDLVDFSAVQSAPAPDGGLAVSAPVRPATSGAQIATWIVRGADVKSANATARDVSTFPAAPASSDDDAAIARSEACVRDILP